MVMAVRDSRTWKIHIEDDEADDGSRCQKIRTLNGDDAIDGD